MHSRMFKFYNVWLNGLHNLYGNSLCVAHGLTSPAMYRLFRKHDILSTFDASGSFLLGAKFANAKIFRLI